MATKQTPKRTPGARVSAQVSRTRVIGYVRHSKAEQGERMSAALQRRAIERYADSQGQSVSEWFTDAKPGSTPITKRPGLRQAVEALRKGDWLLVYRLDRLYRDTERWLVLERTVTKIGARIISTQGEGTNGFDDDDPDAEYYRTMQAAQAQREVRVLGKRIRDGITAKRAQGRQWCHHAPYGHRWTPAGHLAESVSEQRTIKLVHDLRDDGFSYRQVLAELRRRRRFNRVGHQFNLASLQKMLR